MTRLPSKYVVLLIGLVSIIILVTIYRAYRPPQDSRCRQEMLTQANVYACVEPEQFDDLREVQLTLINNTPYVITPAQDTQAYEWGLYKQTQIGWRFFPPESVNRFTRAVAEADTPLQPGQMRTYEGEAIKDVFDANVLNNRFAQITEWEREYPSDGGIFVIGIEYTIHLSAGDETRLTFTNPFTYHQASLEDQTIAIHIQPELVEVDQTKQVEFVITNNTEQSVWLRPLGLSIRGDGFRYSPNFPDIWLRRKVDQTSWQAIDTAWLISKEATEPLEIAAQTTRRLQGADLDTGFIVSEEGIYHWVIPIWAEYYPEGHANRGDGSRSDDEPFLNQRHFVFSEPLIVN